MSISLNSPLYAKPESLEYQMHKKQQDRKRRKNPFVPELFERYFRRNEGTTDYGVMDSAVALSGDFDISLDFWMTSAPLTTGLLGVSTGAGSNFLAVINTTQHIRLKTGAGADLNFSTLQVSFTSKNSLRLVRTGSSITSTLNGVDETLVSGTDEYTVDRIAAIGTGFNFKGIIANLSITDAGTPIHSWAMNDNADTMVDSIGGNNISIINPNAADWGLFQQQTTGEWLGQELWVGFNYSVANVGVVDIIQTGVSWDISTTNGSPSNVADGGTVVLNSQLITGAQYKYSIGTASESVNLVTYDGSFVSTGTALDSLEMSFSATATSRLYLCPATVNTTRVNNASIKEVLSVA